MAPSSGHLLVPKVIRMVKVGISKTASLIRSKLPQSIQTTTTSGALIQPVRVYAEKQSIHPLAFLRQSRSHNNRWFSTNATRTFASSAKPTSGVRYDRSKFPVSKVSKAVSQRGAAPFASALRPNLTGGALPRSAGGYSLGGVGRGGARHFSHTSGCQTQIVQNVSASIRAFLIGGGKARFDGIDPMTGEKRFRSVSQIEDAAYKEWEQPVTKGTDLNFKLCPTITAFYPFIFTTVQGSKLETTSLNSIGLLDNLSIDFARALKDLSAILADLRRLSAFGDLPISITTTASGPVLSVRFPGCDADLVSRLCDEAGVRRGVIDEDDAWDEKANKDVEMALLFPFAPSISPSDSSGDDAAEYFNPSKPVQQDQLDWKHMLSLSTHPDSLHDHTSFEDYAMPKSPFQSPQSPSGYETLRESDFDPDDPYYHNYSPLRAPSRGTKAASTCGEYEGLEGIYRFLQVCEESKR